MRSRLGIWKMVGLGLIRYWIFMIFSPRLLRTEEQVSRNTAVEDVSGVIKYIWPNCTVEVFGSFKTGLFLPSSDVDMVIFESNIRTPQMGFACSLQGFITERCCKKDSGHCQRSCTNH